MANGDATSARLSFLSDLPVSNPESFTKLGRSSLVNVSRFEASGGKNKGFMESWII